MCRQYAKLSMTVVPLCLAIIQFVIVSAICFIVKSTFDIIPQCNYKYSRALTYVMRQYIYVVAMTMAHA